MGKGRKNVLIMEHAAGRAFGRVCAIRGFHLRHDPRGRYHIRPQKDGDHEQ